MNKVEEYNREIMLAFMVELPESGNTHVYNYRMGNNPSIFVMQKVGNEFTGESYAVILTLGKQDADLRGYNTVYELFQSYVVAYDSEDTRFVGYVHPETFEQIDGDDFGPVAGKDYVALELGLKSIEEWLEIFGVDADALDISAGFGTEKLLSRSQFRHRLHQTDFKVVDSWKYNAHKQAQPDYTVAAMSYGTYVSFHYINWLGVHSQRTVKVHTVTFGMTEYHPEPQWFLVGEDSVKNEVRYFALKDISKLEVFQHVGWSPKQ